jgi:Xaa-Pro aminopeptidase
VASGPNTNPWRAEATDRAVEAGDLVFVDTDTVGIEGYFFCVSRTFLCGDVAPTRQQRDLYRSAHDWLVRMLDLIEPGVTCGELADRAPDLPEGCVDQRYECFVHGAGLEEESPSVCHPRDTQPNPHREVREGMVLVVELYCGEVGGREGVKLGEQIILADPPRRANDAIAGPVKPSRADEKYPAARTLKRHGQDVCQAIDPALEADDQRASGRVLVLDSLRHSYVDLDDPAHLEFDYTRLFADVVDAHWPAGEHRGVGRGFQ